MKKLFLLIGLVVFLISFSLYSKEWSNWDKAKDNPKEYLEHITRLAGALYVCEDLNKFHIANALFNWDYTTLTDERFENLLTKEERNEVWQNFEVNVKEFIKNKKIHEKTIEDLGGCNLIGEEVRDYFFSRYTLSDDNYDKYTKLKTTNSYFGIKLFDNIKNYTKKDNKNLGNIKKITRLPMMGATYEIDPPTPNPLLKKYEVWLFADAIYSNYIWMIVGNTKNLSAKDCQKNMHIFIDHYQENKKAKFIAARDKIGIVWNMKIEDFKKINLSDKNMSYRVRVEFDNNDESVQIACYVNLEDFATKNKSAKFELLFSAFLIEQSERKTNLVKGL